MQIPKEAALLRVFIGENDRHHGKPLYDAIVMTAQELQMAGAMVLSGPLSFGKSSRVHRPEFSDYRRTCRCWLKWSTARIRSTISCRCWMV